MLSPFLKFPLPCGCRDPRYLEFSSNYGCDAPDSCRTLVVLGCMDSMACNYDPNANLNVPSICCYPGNCGDRDLTAVCPDLSKSVDLSADNLTIYPVPASSEVRLTLKSGSFSQASIRVIDLYGRVVGSTHEISGAEAVFDVQALPEGIYLIRIVQKDASATLRFIKGQ
ncbi:MAG: T9SS type A sorting domain-containing protein [Bacteroidales bacterium]|nr:T9SS type A sorting domain-containing protein [Bacteroidales bacterium]